MKKTLSILAVAAMTVGMISCEAETSTQETEDLFEVFDQDASTGHDSNPEVREN
ncbi:MAG: hypothetical protein ABJN84_11055 [Flavobacteriaceae bacterium]